ncbi:MarR family winged helix-turn-helix transcriptional regulator [Demequina sp. NBRC 110051]|uniref:MarR family winged helix-turn-helix transcriptional regulator n=1 Tax=Demequina sp. NBRC 110051 TaxID=1570340 RepID=UPI000A0568B4|nr:MarR family winged helix-turn-helix transcriptional regulator [Demequina sp. NBRC 110051]
MAHELTGPEALWFALRKAATMMERHAEAIVSRETGVSLGLYMVLSVLHARDAAVSQQAIADRLGLTKGTVSRLLDGARSAGLAVTAPSPSSRRERVVTLTEAGRAVVDAGDAALLHSEIAAFAQREPERAESMVEGLYAMVAAVQEATAGRSGPR